MRINENKKIICFNSPDVKLFTEMLNDLRFPLLNEIYNNEPLEKEKLFVKLQNNNYLDYEKFEKAYESLLKTHYIEINSDNKIEPTEYGKLFIDLYYERQKFLAYQYNPETKEDVLVESFFEYRNARRYIASEEDLRNTYVLYRGCDRNYCFLDSNGKPCEKLEDVTLFDNYNKAYDFLRTIKDSDARVYNIYELNNEDKVYKAKHNNLTICNGRLCYLKDALIEN